MNKEEKSSNKCPICRRPTHKESKYCIFHAGAEEKAEEEFKKALKEYVDKIKKTDGDHDFRKFIFIGIIDFKKDFNITVFKWANFDRATFEGIVYFSEVTEATFEGNVFFRRTTFKRVAFFERANFKESAIFDKATFEVGAKFGWATFEGKSSFDEVTFEVGPDFKETTFKGDVFFKLIYSFKGLDFSEAKFLPGKKISINVIDGEGKISLKRAYLENTYLDIELPKGVSIDFTDTLLRNTKIEADQIDNHIIQEKNKEFSQAKKIFLLLKNNFHSIGQYEDESWAIGKEKEMERRSYSIESFTKNGESKEEKREGKVPKDKKSKAISYFNWFKNKKFRKWLWSCFCNTIYGYGEKPKNVILSAIFIIFLFAASFSIIGIANPEIIELNGTAIQQNCGNIVDLASKGFLKSSVIRNFSDSLYFSLITFTTLGYGDFRPLKGWGRLLAGSEAFIGAFMIALFVYTFARRTGGR